MLATGPAALSRRGVLAVAAVGVAGGCDLDPRGAEPTVPTPTAGAPSEVGEDTDLLLLDQARAATERALATVLVVRDHHPRLRDSMRPLAVLHRAHATALDEAGRQGADDPVPVPIAGGDPTEALAAVRREEARLQRRLAAWSVQAGSGGFAQLLASMSAGVAAHLVDLPAGP